MADSHDEDGSDGHDHHDHHDHGDEAVHAHEHEFGPVGIAVVTISTSRTLDDDPAGDTLAAAVEEDDKVPTRELVPDEYDTVQGTVDALAGREDVDCIVTTGGTGVTPDDVTIEAVQPLFSKELPGFGELFRARSRDEIGTRVVATRATGGVVDGVPVFCLPGSENAARLGAGIITEEAAHLAGLAGRTTNDEADGDADAANETDEDDADE
ncbi:molybdenum cofactor synthesis domain-containing protein [Halococcus morrhuae DSM 1307]|uniref:Molybdenum cofactor synthesis domain-containing protein n=1 Tax=Halococcus morrhuae DSM 1307 TaxID=931277 RepID=M0MUB5_HALMO|nr:MogA/MoaB family molybdenum cofactor biosynthesis protein [Halococcus morrhuae]EMA48364.1 molybdenum cofactor synthesis domain-containing protein [Halococcus morrhuae DSM 1307]